MSKHAIEKEITQMDNKDYARMKAYSDNKGQWETMSEQQRQQILKDYESRANSQEMLDAKEHARRGQIFEEVSNEIYNDAVKDAVARGEKPPSREEFNKKRRIEMEKTDTIGTIGITEPTRLWDVDTIISKFIKTGFSMSEKIASAMQKTLLYMMVIAFVLRIVMVVLREGDMTEVISEIISMFMVFGFAVALMNFSFYQDVINGFAVDLPRYIMLKISDNTANNGAAFFGKSLVKIVMEAIKNAQQAGVFSLVMNSVSIILNILVLAFIFSICTIFFLLHYVMAYFAMVIGIAIGPLMIPWLVWQPSKFVFDSWVTFMLSCSVQVIAVNIVSTLCYALLHAYNVSPTVISIENLGMTTMMGLSAIALYCTYIIMKTPGLANGLIGGGPNFQNINIQIPGLPFRI
jgi:predicted Fe-S protein YdhL (DUF1289 family)